MKKKKYCWKNRNVLWFVLFMSDYRDEGEGKVFTNIGNYTAYK